MRAPGPIESASRDLLEDLNRHGPWVIVAVGGGLLWWQGTPWPVIVGAAALGVWLGMNVFQVEQRP